MRSFNGTVGILLAAVLIDRGAWWGLEFVRDSVVQGQGAVQGDVPTLRDDLGRQGGAPRVAEAREFRSRSIINVTPGCVGPTQVARITLVTSVEKTDALFQAWCLMATATRGW